MSIIARLFGRQTKPHAFIEINSTFNSFSGTGYNSAAFRAAVDAIARHTAKLQPHSADAGLEALLAQAPNTYMSGYDLLYKTAAAYFTHNNAFMLLQRRETQFMPNSTETDPGQNSAQGITAIYPLTPSSVEFRAGGNGALYGFIDRDTGCRQYRESFFLVGRKNGKSTLLAGLALYMLTSDGEGGAEVYSTATKYAQARLLFDEAHNMIKQSPALARHFRKRKSDLYYEPTMSKFQPLARNSDTLDGLNASFVIMDELHGVKDRNLYEVMRQSQSARRQPLMIMITTAGTVRECIFDDMYAYAANVADGVIADLHFLPILYELDDRSEWTDPTAWRKANPALGTIKKLDDLTAKVERAKQNRNELSGVLCKEFNVRETVKTAWLSFDDINNEQTFDLETFRGAYCIGGVDLSITTDLTCASLLLMKRGDDRKYIVQMYWLPADRLQERVQQDKIPYDKWFDRGLLRLCAGNSINYSDVTAWFVETVKQYDLFPAWVYYDSYSARYFVEEMQMQGFNMVRCIQGAKTLSLPMQMLGTDLQAHKVIYNNNPILKWCLTNTGVQTDRNGNIVPIKNQSPKQRIDGTAALLDCYVGLYEHYAEYTMAI